MNMLRYLFIFCALNLSFGLNAQTTFYCTKNITFKDCKLNFNNTTTTWAQLNVSTLSWSYNEVGSFVIKDGLTQVTIKNDGCLVSPTFSALDDSLMAWQSRCSPSIQPPLDVNIVSPIPLIVENIGIDTVRVLDSVRVWFKEPIITTNDTTHTGVLNSIHNLLVDSLDKNLYLLNDSLKVYFTQPIKTTNDTTHTNILNSIHNLLVDSLDKNVFINNDSLRVWFEQRYDTIDFEYKSYCYRGKSDSGVYAFNVVFSALTPNMPTFMNFLNVDSLSEIFRIDNRTGYSFGSYPNMAVDYVPCERWDEYLHANANKDTLKGLVFMPKAKVVTGVDTLFNCKSIAFGRKNGASGTLVIGYADGDSQAFDVALDDLPTWENGDFISWISYNATASSGVVLKTLGCNQSDVSICAKPVPFYDCEINEVIQCVGWGSASGVWNTFSGCWNTGQ